MRVAIVVPRYGVGVLGGAESLAREFAQAAVARGWEVEVWTTCAHSHYTWENVYPEGIIEINGVKVRRFPVFWRNRDQWTRSELKLARQGFLSSAETYAWLDSAPHSPSLYNYAARNAVNFDVIVALPYVMPLIHYAAWSALEKVVLWPCLHDEPYAYLESTRLLLESVWGVMFYSPEEERLALKLGIRARHWEVLGGGVLLRSNTVSRPKLEVTNFVLYVGRLEEGKNIPLLYEYMQKYGERRSEICLVVAGDGPIKPPSNRNFVYLGFVSEEEKASLYANALVLCQPSLQESFALTVMESWLAGCPVLVHEDCPVTRGHVRRSKGGLWFRTYEDFAGALDWLLEHPDLAARMGENGKRYVLANYTWEAVLSRFEKTIAQWRSGK